MFLLLPVWHKETDAFPKITAALLLINIAVFLVAWPLQNAKSGVVTNSNFERMSETLSGLARQPWSPWDAPTDEYLLRIKQGKSLSPEELATLFENIESRKQQLSPRDRYEWDVHYPVFRGYVEQWRQNPQQDTPFNKYGYSLEKHWFPSLFTHQFLHAGWFHLLGNMLFLWVAGCVLEKQTGLFLGLVYLLGGAAAALIQGRYQVMPAGEIMVGASGSISALIGFALAVLPRAKVTMFYLMILSISPRYGTVDWPVWVIAPLWVLQQLVLANVLAHSLLNNIAFLAHLGGFATGLVIGIMTVLMGRRVYERPT